MNKKESINWYGTYTLSLREIKRFLKVYHQTVIGPVISALIFLIIFRSIISSKASKINGIDINDFIGYGIIMMSIIQNAFSNSSSSFTMSKVLGYIYDILTPPISGTEIVIALLIGAITRGIFVGIAVSLAVFYFINFQLLHPLLLIINILLSCSLLGQLGIMSGLFAKSFDQNFAVTSYIVNPLSFLSGTFYSVQNLPYLLKKISYINPFFYMIDSFRYSLTGQKESNILIGVLYLLILNILMFYLLTALINKGWNVKS
ncbi:ABC transporter permease [Rickettsia endosymbiont of Cardiosporidium cionae]|uniref:ABC transporter permease n=1 Tax=Rickettsia endosymbiont of Cardiosporidium cionae TaxID=2777155 RepID=UPI0018956C85|nr:ABC transporter permease [Rickettsia endosymbiont of Cardiosporidium cionae]KAF8818890.1 Inner membrane transport permease YadH [Rickettsia endosymbiont of Cardiosporidium cionae]